MIHLLATTADDPVNFVSPWLQYGIVGIVALVLARFAYNQIRREQARSDAYQKQVTQLNLDMQTRQTEQQAKYEDLLRQVVPALSDMLKATQQVIDVSNRLQTELTVLERQRNNA